MKKTFKICVGNRGFCLYNTKIYDTIRIVRGAMDYKVSEYYINHGFKSRDVEKAKLYEMVVADGETSRKRLNERLHLRPNNVSEAVQQLIDEKLIVENSNVKPEGRGRPEVMLMPNPNRFVVITVWVLAGKMMADLVNMGGTILWKDTESIPENYGNEEFLDSVIRVLTKAKAHVSAEQTLLGIGISMPGGVNWDNMKWSFNSRFGGIVDLDFSGLSSLFGVPVRLIRLVDSQLKALNIMNSEASACSVLMIHWGYGVGASFSLNGEIPKSLRGSVFGIGHVKVDRTEAARLCDCGERGCLEAFCGGRALGPEVVRILGRPLGRDDEVWSEVIASCKLSESKPFRVAIEHLSNVLDNMVRIIFPDKIVIYGPFLSNAWVRETLLDSVRRKIPKYARPLVEISVLEGSLEERVSVGCTFDFFRNRLIEMLVFKSE